MVDYKKNYSISEVSKITGYDTHVLRYYENEFNIQIPRSESNRRFYTYKEIECFLYLKQLQSKGLTNKQIKLVFDSPEILITSENTVEALSSKKIIDPNQSDIEPSIEAMNNAYNTLNDMIISNINLKLEETKYEIINQIINLLEGRTSTENNSNHDKDVLLCENAKLKMKLKEKSYEVAELKDKIKRINCQKESFWKRIFLRKQTMTQ